MKPMDFSHITEEWMSAIAAGLVLTMVAGATTMTSGQSAPSSAASQNVPYEDTITVEKNGEVIARFHNTLTDQGKEFIRGQLSDVSTEPLASIDRNASHISVGNGSNVAAGDQVLDKEITKNGLSRAEGNTFTLGNDVFIVNNTFTATNDVGVVNTTGLNWNSSNDDPTLVSGGKFAAEANILNGDKLTVTHNITIS